MTTSSLSFSSKNQPQSDSLRTCPECGGAVARGPHRFEVRVGRRSVQVTGDFERCTGECGELYFGPGEMDAVLERASETIRAEEQLLSPAEIKAFRKQAGLTQSQLEQLLGAGPKTVVRWEKGTVIQNGATDALLRILIDVPEALQYQIERRRLPLDRRRSEIGPRRT